MGAVRELVIVGSGPGGYVAAIRASQLGKKVTVIERGDLGGICLNAGCIPSKALITVGKEYKKIKEHKIPGIHGDVQLEFAEIQKWKQGIVTRLTRGVKSLLKGNGVEVITGTAVFQSNNELLVIKEGNGDNERILFQQCIIATGSRPIMLPGLPWGKRILSSTEALSLEHVPEKIIVVGGGFIGVELGTAYANFGSNVTIVEGMPRILAGFDEDMVQLVENGLTKRNNVEVHTGVVVEGAQEVEDGVEVSIRFNGGGGSRRFKGDLCVITAGRSPNTDQLGLENTGVMVDEKGYISIDEHCATNVKGIFAIGDVCRGAALAHRASWQGKVAAENTAGKKVVDDQFIPSVVFSEPELASVGLSYKEAVDQGYQAAVKRFPYAVNGRALTMMEADGFIQLVFDEEEGLLLGAQLAGPFAGELINELTVALQSGFTVEDLTLSVHFHPSVGESIVEAAELALGYPVHVL